MGCKNKGVDDLFSVYVLYSTNENKVRYIGVSSNPRTRFRSHLSCYDSNTHKNNWIKREGKSALRMKVLRSYDSKIEAYSKEKDLIALGRLKGLRLLNIHDGGFQSMANQDESRFPWGKKKSPMDNLIRSISKLSKEISSEGLRLEVENLKKINKSLKSKGDDKYISANLMLINDKPWLSPWEGQKRIGDNLYPNSPVK